LRYWHVGSHLADACALEVMLCDAAGDPTWFAHPERAGAIDVAAIPIELPPGRHVRPINALDLDDELTVEVGMETFVLGYPLDRRPTGTLPIWKRASIATEPSLQPNTLPTFLIDAATRSSMSGAPVIVRSRAHNGNGHSNGHNGSSAPITRLLGVYSGRLGASDVEAQLGIVWRADALEETIAGRCRARRPFIS